jgi:hypothetical protein
MITSDVKLYYYTHYMGLTAEQVQSMLPIEVERHCDEVIRKRIEARGMYNPSEANGAVPKKTKIKKP